MLHFQEGESTQTQYIQITVRSYSAFSFLNFGKKKPGFISCTSQ